MEKPLVSIIIPTYNRAHLICETLDSVIAQTYINWECIVVDDGSTDTTSELLTEYCKKDTRFKYYHRPKDRPKGANACRNYGFEKSKGEFINWFDSDDLLKPKKIELQINYLHNSNYDFTICQTLMFDDVIKREIGLRAEKLMSKNLFEDYILMNVFWLTGAPLWKRKFLIDNNLLFNEKLQQAQDYDFHMRVLSVSENYLPMNDPLVIFKHHSNNMSNSKTDNPSKIFSNAKVKGLILKNYKNKLTSETLINIYKQLLGFYKFSLRNKQFINAIYIYKSLLINVNVLSISSYYKFLFLLKLVVSFFSFLLFSKGNKLMIFKI